MLIDVMEAAEVVVTTTVMATSKATPRPATVMATATAIIMAAAEQVVAQDMPID